MDSYKKKLAEIERDTEGMKPNEIGARFSSELEQKGKTINDIVRDFKEVSKGTEIITLDDFIKRYADDGKWADIKDHPEQLMHDIPKNVTVIDQLGILHKAGSSVIASRSEEPGKTRPETDSSKAKPAKRNRRELKGTGRPLNPSRAVPKATIMKDKEGGKDIGPR